MDYDLILEEMAKQDPALAETWDHILSFWIGLNREMEVMDPILPDGLPTDDSLCIVVMGFYLESDGGIRKELEDRLNVALASAEKYPNAKILRLHFIPLRMTDLIGLAHIPLLPESSCFGGGKPPPYSGTLPIRQISQIYPTTQKHPPDCSGGCSVYP